MVTWSVASSSSFFFMPSVASSIYVPVHRITLPYCSFNQFKTYSGMQHCAFYLAPFCHNDWRADLLPLAGASAHCSLVYPGTLRPSNPLFLTDGTVLCQLTMDLVAMSVRSKIFGSWAAVANCWKPSLYSKVSGFIAFPGGKGVLCSRLASPHHLTCSVVAVRDPDFQTLRLKLDGA